MVNEWLCQKRRFGIDSVRSSVELWDTSALQADFRLARFALLGQAKEALDLAERMVDRDELSLAFLQDWPLLSEVRELPEYGGVLAKLVGKDNEDPSE